MGGNKKPTVKDTNPQRENKHRQTKKNGIDASSHISDMKDKLSKYPMSPYDPNIYQSNCSSSHPLTNNAFYW